MNKKRFLCKILILSITILFLFQTHYFGESEKDDLLHENLRLKSIIDRLQAPHAKNRFQEMNTGIPEKSVTDVAHIGDTLYFQTMNNVYELKNYRVKILLNRRVQKLFTLRDFGLYFNVDKKLIRFFDGKSETLFSSVSSLYQTEQGDLILRVNRKKSPGSEFFCLQKNDTVKKLTALSIPMETAVIAGGDLKDRVFFVTKEKIYLYQPKAKKVTEKKNEFGLSTESTQKIFYHPAYGYLFSGAKGIIAYKRDRFYSFNREQGLDPSYLKVAAVDRSKRVWLVSQTFGLAVGNESGWRYYDTRDGLANLFINSVTQWQEKFIFATDNGLFCMDETAWNPLIPGSNFYHDISGVFLSAYLDPKTGHFYFGENNGGILRISGSVSDQPLEYFTTDTGEKISIYSILRYKNHILLASDDGIKTLKNGRIIHFEDFPYYFVTYSLYYDLEYRCLFVCGENGVFYRLDNQKDFVRLNKPDGLIWKIFKEPGDTFWILTIGGLFKAHFEEKDKEPTLLKRILFQETDDNFFATAMARFNDKSHLVATNKGIFILENDNLLKRGIFKKDVFSLETNHLLKTRKGEWIISTTKGIIRIRGESFVLQDIDDGLRDHYISRTIEDRQGNLWAVTDRGIVFQDAPKPRYISMGVVSDEKLVFVTQKGQPGEYFEIDKEANKAACYLFGMPVKPLSAPLVPRIENTEITLRLFAFSPFLTADQKANFFIQAGNRHFKIGYKQPKILTLKSSDLSSGPVPVILEYMNPTGPGYHIIGRVTVNNVKKISFLIWVSLILILSIFALLFFMYRERRKQRFIGPFRLNKMIGRGGMGEVWKAYDMNNRRPVALKIVHSHLVDDLKVAERLKREMDFISRVKHKNIVTTYERGIYKDRVYISMEFVDGHSLSVLIGQQSLSIEEALVIGAAAADALHAIHSADIIHRDVKPQNILIYSSRLSKKSFNYYQHLADSIRITDFGIAKGKYTHTLTETGMFVGTINYVSPQQVRGEKIDYRSDIWSLGVILYEMLCKRLPFESPNPVELLGKIIGKPIEQPSKLNPDIDAELEQIILRALNRDVNRRYQDAGSLCADLRHYLKKHYNISL